MYVAMRTVGGGPMLLAVAVTLVACSTRAAPAPPAAAPARAAIEQRTEQPPGEWAQVVDAAKREGKLVVASQAGSDRREALMAFRQRYPEIELEYTGAQGRDFVPKVLAEQRGGQYLWDIYVGGGNAVVDFMQAGGMDPLPRDLPETRPAVNDAYWRRGFEDGFLDDSGQFAYAFVGIVDRTIHVNRDVIRQADLNSGADLLRPELRGKISWNEPRQTGKGALAAQQFLIAYGEDYLRGLLVEQQVVVTDDIRQQVEWVVRGRYPIAIGLASAGGLDQFQRQGAGLNVVTVEDPASFIYTSSSGVVSLLHNPPHPNAARVFINWLLSADGQRTWVQATTLNSRRLDVPIGKEAEYAEPEIDYPNVNKQQYEPLWQQAVAVAREVVR